MNAIELLKADHDKVDRLFQKVKADTEGEKHEELFKQIKAELDVHTHIEETILYPVLKQIAETRAITFEGYEEHGVAKTLLEEMNSMDVTSEVWTAKLKVLQEAIEHHVEEEEGDMFKDAREALSQEQIDEIGEKMQLRKKQLAAASSASA